MGRDSVLNPMPSNVILRVRSTTHSTQIANSALRDRHLSFKARGLLGWLLSHADGWKTSEQTVADQNNCGRGLVSSALEELEARGYFARRQVRDKGRFVGYEWWVTDTPPIPVHPPK